MPSRNAPAARSVGHATPGGFLQVLRAARDGRLRDAEFVRCLAQRLAANHHREGIDISDFHASFAANRFDVTNLHRIRRGSR
nr:hypothetical protein [Burkholderia glumae]